MSVGTENKGAITWQSPSNIALVKYWGKHGDQLPRNPSLSMTLKSSVTTTTLRYEKRTPDSEPALQFLFEGARNESFEKRIEAYVTRLLPDFPFLASYRLTIESSNTFPHSSGIASSAAAFSALALCVMSLKKIIDGKEDNTFLRESSRLARLGSGSACRSVYGGYTIWGEVENVPGYSNDFAQPLLSETHPLFRSFYDAILIVSSEKKKVGSSAGHVLMENHPFAQSRFRQANRHAAELIGVLQSGDIEKYIEIVENEALTLHGLMMSSSPGYILMKKETMEIIEKIREYRRQKNVPVSFTLDAGPNVHVLYPAAYRTEVLKFVNDELKELCDGGRWIDDMIGEGPKLLNG